MSIAYNISNPDDLPNDLEIRSGRIVDKTTGQPPEFPEIGANGFAFEGAQMSVVPRANLQRMMRLVRERRVLCGEILATLRVNYLRQALTTENDAEFERLLDGWRERLIGFRPTPPEIF